MFLLLMTFAAAQASNAAGATITSLAATTETIAGQPITLPSGPIEVRASLYVIAVGAQLPVHKHPSPRYGYVLDGNLAVTILSTGTCHVYKKGDFIVEAVDEWHFAQNVGSAPVRLLVIDQAPKGLNNVIVQGHR